MPIHYENIVCLCFGITSNDLKNGIPPMAGRACGSCLPQIKKKEFKKIMGMYPGPLVVKLDALMQEWSKDQALDITIESIVDDKIDVLINPYSKEKLQLLSDYFLMKQGTRFFLRGIL
jgi:hypothetical protein